MANERKNTALGMNFSTASAQLKKLLMFRMMQRLGDDNCYRCGTLIETPEQLSVEHKIAWLSAEDPKAAFFDLENIAFSHLSPCNRPERADTCKRGHQMPPLKGYCRICKNISDSLRKKKSPYREYNKTYQKNYWQSPERKEWNRERSRQDYIRKNLDA